MATNLRSFINAINAAISESTESIAKRNEKVLEEYFYEESSEVIIENEEFDQRILDSVSAINVDRDYNSFSLSELNELIDKVGLRADFDSFNSEIRKNYNDEIPADDAKLIGYVSYYKSVNKILEHSIQKLKESEKDASEVINTSRENINEITATFLLLKRLDQHLNKLRKNKGVFGVIPKSKRDVFDPKIDPSLREAIEEYKALLDVVGELKHVDLLGRTAYAKAVKAIGAHFQSSDFDELIKFLKTVTPPDSKGGISILDFIKRDINESKEAKEYIELLRKWANWLATSLDASNKIFGQIISLRTGLDAESTTLSTSIEQKNNDISDYRRQISENGFLQSKFFPSSNENLVLNLLSFVDSVHESRSTGFFKLFSSTRRYKRKTIQTLIPKTVRINYPATFDYATPNNDKEYKVVSTPVEVPLITLIPLGAYNIEKAVFTANFKFDVNGDDINLDFSKASSQEELQSNFGKLEITLGPKESPEGLKAIIESYETYLKRQIV
jgi:hypothetical protein